MKSEITGRKHSDMYFCAEPSKARAGIIPQVVSMFKDTDFEPENANYLRVAVANSYDVETALLALKGCYDGCGLELPATSIITAPPISGADVSMIAIGMRAEGETTLSRQSSSNGLFNSATTVSGGNLEHLFLGNCAGELNGSVRDVENLARGSLVSAKDKMIELGWTFRDTQRTWFSIEGVNREGEANTYQPFNRARKSFLEAEGYKGRYFPSTGVGLGDSYQGRFGEMGLWAMRGDAIFVPMDNYLQTQVYRYNEGEDYDPEKSNVTFERGMLIITDDIVYYIVSGTASIRKNKEVGETLEEQTHMTIDNIRALLEGKDEKPYQLYHGLIKDTMMAVTYVKPGQDPKDIARMVEIFECYDLGPKNIPHLFVVNEMCYRPLLMETELIAATPRAAYDRRAA